MKRTSEVSLGSLGLLVLICCCLILCISDNQQQNSYKNARMGYRYMEEGHYQEASTKFTEYLSTHSSPIYWKLVENINGEDCEYSYQKILNALKQCEMELN